MSPFALVRWQRSFCMDGTEDGFRQCRRYLLSRLGVEAPLGMLPNGFVFGSPLT